MSQTLGPCETPAAAGLPVPVVVRQGLSKAQAEDWLD
jgi:hypothetical protein